MDKISVIVPCFNEDAMIDIFYSEFTAVMLRMNNVEFELILINDGSKDRTYQKILSLAEKDDRVKYISFSKNFGKEAAMLAGINYVRIHL